MILKLGKKTESGHFIVVNEMGDEIFVFTGDHIADLRLILNKFKEYAHDGEQI